MTDNFEHHEASFDADALELSWVKVWLHFGPQALEPSDEAVAESVSKILDRLGEADEAGSAHRAELLEKFQNMVVTVEDFEEFCKTGFDADRARIADDEAQVVDIPASEMLDDGEVATDAEVDLTPESLRDVAEQMSFLETIKQEIEKAAREHEDETEELFLDTTVEQVLEGIRERALISDELLVVEHDDTHVNLYVLCLSDEEAGKIFAAEVDSETGEATAGQPFDDFLQNLLDELPVRGGMSATEESFMARGPVTYLGEELVLYPDYRAVALVEMSASDLLWKTREAGLTEPINTIPESEGWTYVMSSAQTVIDLLGFTMRPAVVAQVSDTYHKLGFIMPGNSEDRPPSKDADEMSWAEYITHITGEYEDTGASGASVSLVWGAQKEILKYVPQGSDAQDMLWELPGLLPEPLVGVQKNDEVENLTWIYGLDEGESRRLRQYVEDQDSEIGMESVLQLLGLSSDLMYLANGSKEPADFVGARAWEPDMPLYKAVTEDFQTYPNGTDPLSRVKRAYVDNPWLFLVDGAVNLGASGFLVARARRQFMRGQSARATGSAAAILAAMGVLDFAVSLAQSKQKNQGTGFGVLIPDAVLENSKDSDWFKRLKEDVEAEKNKEMGVVHTSETPVHANGVVRRDETGRVLEPNPTSLDENTDDEKTQNEEKGRAEQAAEKAKDVAKKFLRKFF